LRRFTVLGMIGRLAERPLPHIEVPNAPTTENWARVRTDAEVSPAKRL
jgi:hypothetical protein